MIREVNLLISFGAGLLSFLSACVLPLVPAYVSLIGGLTLKDLKESRYKKSELVGRSLVFIAGFSIVFILMGIFVWSVIRVGGEGIPPVFNVIAGIIVIVMGLNIIFDFLAFLNMEKRFHLKTKPATLLGVMAAGLAMGAGWSPCIGPNLSGIIALTASGEFLLGVLNMVSFSLGLGMPFFLLAVAFIPVSGYLDKIKRHLPALRIASGIILTAIGVLILLGQLVGLSILIQQAGFFLEEIHGDQPWTLRIVFTIVYAVLGLLPMGRWLLKNRKQAAGEKPKGLRWRVIWLSLFGALAILEIIGVLESGLLLARWFSVGVIVPL